MTSISTDQHRHEATVENFAFMRDTGETFLGCARRLGLKPKTLERILDRYGVPYSRLQNMAGE